MRMFHFQTQNTPICPEQNFLVQTIIITFIYLLALFTGQNLKKILTADPELWGSTFLAQNGPFAPPQKNFLGKLLISLSSTYYPLSLCKILMKFFHRIQSYEDAQFLGLKWPIFPNDNFFQKAC